MGMKQARATDLDIEAAQDIVAALTAFAAGHLPEDDDEGSFNSLDHDHLVSFHETMMRMLRERPGGLERVVYGMKMLCDPNNEVLDLEVSHVELHPKIRMAQALVESARQIDTDMLQWGVEIDQPKAAVCVLELTGAAFSTEKKAFIGRIKDAVYNAQAIGSWAVELYQFEAHSVTEYSRDSLVERALRNARNRSPCTKPLWAVVMDAFGLGSNYSAELCRLHGLDPDQEMPGTVCEACQEREAEEAEEEEGAWERDNQSVYCTLLLISHQDTGHITPAIVESWTDEEARAAQEWAWALHTYASDNPDVVVPPVPACVTKGAAP